MAEGRFGTIRKTGVAATARFGPRQERYIAKLVVIYDNSQRLLVQRELDPSVRKQFLGSIEGEVQGLAQQVLLPSFFVG